MRIAWFHSHLLHVNSGGTRFVLDYAAELRRRHGHDVTVFCDVSGAAAADHLRNKGIGLTELDVVSTNSATYWLTLPARIRRKRARLEGELAGFDIIINTMFPMNWLVCESRLPTIQICYEPFAFFYDQGFLRNFKPHHRAFFRLMKLLYARVDKKAARSMSRLLTINVTNIEKVRQTYGVTPAVVYAGVDVEQYTRAAEHEIRELRGKYPGSLLLFHSTDLTGIKGSYPLLDVIAALRTTRPDVKLLLTIYVDDPAGKRKFLQRVEELGLTDTVEYLGCLSKAQLPLFYSAVDFVCQPSVNQSTNWALREALLCGTPIIGGIESEEVDEFVNGVRIDVRDVDTSVQKLARLFENRATLSVEATADEFRRKSSIAGCVAQLNDILVESM